MQDFARLTKLLCDVTRDGPVSQWVDRMAEVVRKTGVELDGICWQGAPSIVAMSVYDEFRSQGKLQKLEDVCKEVAGGSRI